jgi:mRNA interferase MazF
MTTINQGDIVLVPFPFTDYNGTKRRPAMVVSANWYNRTKSFCILVPITSSIPINLHSDEILIKGTDINYCGLAGDSLVKTEIISTIEKYLFFKRLGSATTTLMSKVITNLQKQFQD